jgi:ankyrin repeat protein
MMAMSIALHRAVDGGSVDCVNHCLKMGANVNVRNHVGSTPLHYASSWGHVNVVSVLLDAGAIVDMTDDFGWTPLHDALRNTHVPVARLLIDRGAKMSNIKPDDEVIVIPDWITTIIESQSRCRLVSITIIGMHKYRLTTLTGNNDINVIRLISKHIWSTRMDDVWGEGTQKMESNSE